ncbi:MAG: dockerin type I repeat-containing protein [Christensenellales bacterium]
MAYESNGSAFVPRDVNGDGQVMTDDALTAMRCALGLINLDASQLRAADMDGDGAVSQADALDQSAPCNSCSLKHHDAAAYKALQRTRANNCLENALLSAIIRRTVSALASP